MAFNIVCWAQNVQVENVFASQIDELPFELVALDSSKYNRENIDELKNLNPKVVVNFLPDSREHWGQSYIEGARVLAELAQINHIPFIQVSSYVVFGDERLEQPVPEDTKPSAIDEYAKFLAELEAIATGTEHGIVLRTSWILDACDRSVFSEVASSLLLKKANTFVSDHRFGCPISLQYLVDSMIAIVKQVLCGADNWGIFNLCSADSCSEAEIADHLVRLLNTDYGQDVVLPDVAAEHDNRSVMPFNANLAAQRVTDCFGIQLPTWRKGFKMNFKQWLEQCLGNDELLKKHSEIAASKPFVERRKVNRD